MRIFLIILTTLLFSTLTIGQSLNSKGHIISDTESDLTFEIKHKNHQYYIHYEGLILKGSHLIKVGNTLVTIDRTCSTPSSTLRSYQEDGIFKFSRELPQSPNVKPIDYSSSIQYRKNGAVIMLDVKTNKQKKFNTTTLVAYNNEQLITFDNSTGVLTINETNINLPDELLELRTDGSNNTYLFGKSGYSILNANHSINHFQYQSGHFFTSKLIQGQLYWSERTKTARDMNFALYSYRNNALELKDEVVFNYLNERQNVVQPTSAQLRSTNEPIPSPLKPSIPDYPFIIGNSNGEYQNYGGSPYVHQGIDILGAIQEPVFACKQGIVARVTKASGIYNEVTVASLPAQAEGYLYLHLLGTSIPHLVGDTVQVGDYLGQLVEWPVYDFHHIHFARVRPQTTNWLQNYWTIDNVLTDITNFLDTTPPVFEPLSNQHTIALRSKNTQTILSPTDVKGEFDIVCHVHDKSNSTWRVDVNSLRFELWKDLQDSVPVYQQKAFDYNFDIPVYFDQYVIDRIVRTVYSNYFTWITYGDYTNREFFQQVSRSNGDNVLDDLDELEYFNSTQFPDGDYVLRIHAEDAAGNSSFTDLAITLNNGITTSTIDEKALPVIEIYPNPSIDRVHISSKQKIRSYRLLNADGRLIRNETVDGYAFQLLEDHPGQYLLELNFDNGQKSTRKIIVLE